MQCHNCQNELTQTEEYPIEDLRYVERGFGNVALFVCENSECGCFVEVYYPRVP